MLIPAQWKLHSKGWRSITREVILSNKIIFGVSNYSATQKDPTYMAAMEMIYFIIVCPE